MATAIILIGFMGSGKTVIGQRVAEILDWDFADADEKVVGQMDISIPEAFQTKGEDYFRHIEADVVLGLLDSARHAKNGMVISLGGGAVTISKVRERLSHEPMVVLLDEDLATAFERAGGGSRPLAKDLAGFRELYEERSHLYRQVTGFIIDTRDKSPDTVAEEIVVIARDRIDKA